jgi:ATP-dependent helicase/nuclease subunit A
MKGRVIKMMDANERAQALDVTRSFIVQAPAGSGKTELLIQRLLSLLAQACDEPEQIIAITFTRKAAAEMRKRLLNALTIAQTQPAPAEPHALVTWNLARAVLDIDAKRQWDLLQNPNRLRLQTIDSLCASIARSAPYLSQFGAEPSVFNDPMPYYQHAARALLKQLAEDTPWQPALARLLLHLDNDWTLVQQLLTSMLGRRDQWLGHLLENNDLASKRKALESSLKHVITDTLEHTVAEFPEHCQRELLMLLRSAASVLSENNAENSYEAFLSDEGFPGTSFSDLSSWQNIANFLLVQTGEWRKSFTVNQGFLAPSSTKLVSEREVRQQIKLRLQDFMSEINENEALRQALVEVQQLPPPRYSDEQWQILSDLVILLPILAAQLQLVFREHRGVDFIEVSTRARQALGAADNPTDIALNWDYRIRHLLVDEFQDTSTPQYHLLELLSSGWQRNDGRTLFLVGDPMQSIYRFREAEVGLFLRAQLHGLGDIPLKSLQLSVNFRSEPRLIDWVNASFLTIFPIQDEMSVGAVSYALSYAPKSTPTGEVCIHPLMNKDQDEEALRVISIINEARRDNPQVRIAILVRARHHASAIFTALQGAGLRYQAQDMERLSHRAVIQDCFALTRALLHPADRIAWLSLLRAPWCGITLADLLVITQAAGSGSLWPILEAFEKNPGLSTDAKTRLMRVVPILQRTLAQRGRVALRRWIQTTWQALGGPACIRQTADYQNADRYFALIEQISLQECYDFSSLENQLNHLFAAVDPEADDRLQLMTMHKAKGLEFDIVILPALERTAMADRQQLLLWWERPRPNAEADLILGPIKPAASPGDAIYNYLRFQEARKTHYETTRVLYVAATRAKKALHLIGSVVNSTENTISTPSEDSFLGLLWPHVEAHFQAATLNPSLQPEPLRASAHKIGRLPANFSTSSEDFELNIKSELEAAVSTQSEISPSEFKLDSGETMPPWNIDQSSEHIGTVIHRTLERIANEGLLCWDRANLSDYHAVWQVQLLQLGIAHTALDSAIEII